MLTYVTTFDALGDPTRRAIFDRLRERPRSVGELADLVPVSRPAVSQHLKVLSDAGLVAYHRDGTRHVYRLDPDGLRPLRAWIEGLWDDVLRAYAGTPSRGEPEGGTS